MAGKKRALKRFLLVLPVIILFIALSNLCDKGVLPAFLQKPIDAANNATGGLIYQKADSKAGLSVHYIDVGQGDSILICCEGKNMLIDGGVPDEGADVENYLRGEGIARLDYVVGTHPDDDHIGGLAVVIRDFDIGTVLFPDTRGTTQAYEKFADAVKDKGKQLTVAKPPDSYTLGTAKITVLAPLKNYSDDNDMSVVLRLCYKSNSFLFTGDAAKESEEDMLAQGEDLSADVLKVGHHGSSTATSPAFLKAVHPRYAVISVGAGNSYGLPDASVTRELKDAGITTLRTDLDGTIVFYSDGKNITYKEEKNGGNFNESS